MRGYVQFNKYTHTPYIYIYIYIYISFGLASVGNDAVKYATHMPSLKHMPTVPIVSMGKEGRTLIGPLGYLNRKTPFIALP